MIATKRVLVVEDDDEIRTFVSLALADGGYEANGAPHGAIALELVRQLRPQLILLDLMMPVLDGWGFLQACRLERLWTTSRSLS